MNPTSRRILAPLAAALILLAASVAAFVAVPAAIAQAALAEGVDLPAAEQILARAAEAAGGAEALQKLHNLKATGTFSMPAMGIEASLTQYQAEPARIRTIIESEALGRMESGGDGEVFYESSLLTGTRLLEGEELAVTRRLATFNLDLHWRELFQSWECVALADVDGTPCYEVVFKAAEGEPLHVFFGKEDGRQYKMSMVVVTSMGRIDVVSYPSDYREVSGATLPFRNRQVLMGLQEMIQTLETVEFNTELPPDAFTPPAEVQALLSAPAAPADPPDAGR